MKILKSIILSLIILFPMAAHSQEKTFTLDDLTPGGRSFYSLYQKRSIQPRLMRWYGDKLTYVKGDSILLVSDEKGKKDEVITSVDAINKLMGEDKTLLKGIAHITALYENNVIQFNGNDQKSHVVNIATGEKIAAFGISATMANHDFSLAAKAMAYTSRNNLYVQDKDGKETAITNDDSTGIVNGQSVHQNEFGINEGIYWSPTGTALAFYRMDQSMVTEYPLVDVSARTAKLKPRVYPMAGMKSHHVTVGIYNIASGKTTFLKTGTPKEKFLTNVTWSPDEKYIYIAELNRGQDTCVLNRYDASTGRLEATLFTETHPKYVEPQDHILFLKNDPTKFVWMSRKDGYNHAYLYSTSGEMLKQITKGDWDIESVLGWDEKGENLVYTSNEVTPIEKHIFKVNIKNNKRLQLSKEVGVHYAQLNPSGKYLYDRYTSQYNPGKIALTNIKTNKSTIVHESKNPYQNYVVPEIELGKLTANDGKTDLYYRLIKPTNFDPNKKYPVIVYVYGGPHSQLVDNSWMAQARGWDIYMAQKGYVVFTLDNRGTLNRGFDFENIIHRQLGIIETQDQMTGVDFLKSQSYVDANRIGVYGWSFGGFMTLNLMLRHPDVFKVGVAGGPVADWKYYEIMYGERYMDSPQENEKGYNDASMVERAGDLKGRLLMIHGDEDPVVLMQHTMQFMKKAIKEGTHPDLFIYPGHEHNVLGTDRVHLHEHITRYFDDFLLSK